MTPKDRRPRKINRGRELVCLNAEIRAVDFYRNNLLRIPDGSFMQQMFKKGYDAALRDAASSAACLQ